MSIGVLVLNFGEPDEPTVEKVEPYLERIFLQNRRLERHVDEAALARARKLARDRAPGLVEEYRAIGGSPLNAQANRVAQALESELTSRLADARVYSGFQFTRPFVSDVVAAAWTDGVDTLVALPVYPMCGQSTTVAALDDVRAALDDLGWAPRFVGISGWHHHPVYRELRVEHVRSFLAEEGLDLEDPDTILYFSVHGTPVKYVAEGNRYDRYVEEHCRAVANGLGAERYAVGFQNHSNRGVPWTQPENEDRIREVSERRLVVVPISFMNEQSETLAELDHELRGFVEDLGKEFHRVPVPFDLPGFPGFLAGLVTEALAADGGASTHLSPCRCRTADSTWCTNGNRDLPPSPYVSVEGEATIP